MGAGRKAEQMTMTLVETMECWTLNQFEPVLEAESWFKREGFPAEGYPHFDSFDANWLTPWLDAHDTPELRVAVAESIERQLRGRVGREAIAKSLADRFKVIPDMRWDHKEYIYAGNRAISVWTVKGKGATGEDLNYEGCDIYTFRGGKICGKNTFWKIVENKDRL